MPATAYLGLQRNAIGADARTRLRLYGCPLESWRRCPLFSWRNFGGLSPSVAIVQRCGTDAANMRSLDDNVIDVQSCPCTILTHSRWHLGMPRLGVALGGCHVVACVACRRVARRGCRSVFDGRSGRSTLRYRDPESGQGAQRSDFSKSRPRQPRLPVELLGDRQRHADNVEFERPSRYQRSCSAPVRTLRMSSADRPRRSATLSSAARLPPARRMSALISISRRRKPAHSITAS